MVVHSRSHWEGQGRQQGLDSSLSIRHEVGVDEPSIGQGISMTH